MLHSRDYWKQSAETRLAQREQAETALARTKEVLAEWKADCEHHYRGEKEAKAALQASLAGHLAACKAETVFDRYAIAALPAVISWDGTDSPERAIDRAFDHAKAAMIRRKEALAYMASFSQSGSTDRPETDSPATPTEDGPDTDLASLDSLRL